MCLSIPRLPVVLGSVQSARCPTEHSKCTGQELLRYPQPFRYAHVCRTVSSYCLTFARPCHGLIQKTATLLKCKTRGHKLLSNKFQCSLFVRPISVWRNHVRRILRLSPGLYNDYSSAHPNDSNTCNRLKFRLYSGSEYTSIVHWCSARLHDTCTARC